MIHRALTALWAAALLLAIIAPSRADTLIDGINDSLTPATNGYWYANYTAWAYTPTETFHLTRVETMYGPNGTPRPITLEVWSGNPMLGGTLLRAGGFMSAASVFVGSSITPVTLVAGQPYAIGFVGGGNPPGPDNLNVNLTSDAGAEDLIPYWYGANGYEYEVTDASVAAHPILKLYGERAPVPEPGALAFLLCGAPAALACLRRRRSR